MSLESLFVDSSQSEITRNWRFGDRTSHLDGLGCPSTWLWLVVAMMRWLTCLLSRDSAISHPSSHHHSHTVTQSHRHSATQSHRHDATQPHRHTVTQSHNHKAPQSHSHTATQPHSHTATQSQSHTVTQSQSHTATQPHSHTDTWPSSHTVTYLCSLICFQRRRWAISRSASILKNQFSSPLRTSHALNTAHVLVG